MYVNVGTEITICTLTFFNKSRKVQRVEAEQKQETESFKYLRKPAIKQACTCEDVKSRFTAVIVCVCVCVCVYVCMYVCI
jgi:hypothetical protein